MKKVRPFAPLLKFMLGFYRYGLAALSFWLLAYGIVVIMLGHGGPGGIWPQMAGADFMFSQVMTATALCCFLTFVSTPIGIQLLAGPVSLEYFFTRAIDRGVWLRAERVGQIVLIVLPLFLNWMVVTLGGFPREAQLFAAWLWWLALILIFLVAGYFAVAFTWWQKKGWHHSNSAWRPWLGGAMVLAPSYAVIPLFLCAFVKHVNLLEQNYEFFAQHPIPLMIALAALMAIVQPLSERNLNRLEFEFV